MSIKRDVEFLYEISPFRHLDRVWKQFLNADVANNAEHSFRVAWIALTISKYENKGNHEKILKMAMLHDLPESRCGDVHYLSRQYVLRKEVEAMTHMCASTVHEKELNDLMKEYEDRKSIESRIVKDADNLDVELDLNEQAAKGHSLGKIWTKDRKKQVYPKLFTKSGKKLWDEIAKTNPHDWHLNSPHNRFKMGDWATSEVPKLNKSKNRHIPDRGLRK